jgi:phosphatidate cytidylyltransferase
LATRSASGRSRERGFSEGVSRLLVAAAAIPIVLGLLYLGGWWAFALAAVAAAIALHEFWVLARPLSPLAPAGYVGGLLALLGAELGGVLWMVGGAMTTFALAFLLKGISGARQAPTVSISATVMAAVWVGVGLGFLLCLRDMPDHGRLAAFTVVLSVWAGDTFAYFGGRLLGRHKLAPTTSPGKTWEGFAFGTAATIFVAFVTLYDTRHTYLSIGEAVALGAVLAVVAPLGDLFESLLKRDMKVKDTGTLLGGHGGMLDRIDALLFAAPAAYYCILAFLQH